MTEIEEKALVGYVLPGFVILFTVKAKVYPDVTDPEVNVIAA